MEIYKDLKSPASKEFEKLLNSQLSKTKIEEGKVIEGKINKISDKFVFLFIEGLKSEPVLDINELKSICGKMLKTCAMLPYGAEFVRLRQRQRVSRLESRKPTGGFPGQKLENPRWWVSRFLTF